MTNSPKTSNYEHKVRNLVLFCRNVLFNNVNHFIIDSRSDSQTSNTHFPTPAWTNTQKPPFKIVHINFTLKGGHFHFVHPKSCPGINESPFSVVVSVSFALSLSCSIFMPGIKGWPYSSHKICTTYCNSFSTCNLL